MGRRRIRPMMLSIQRMIGYYFYYQGTQGTASLSRARYCRMQVRPALPGVVEVRLVGPSFPREEALDRLDPVMTVHSRLDSHQSVNLAPWSM